jgi:hypothetical protein
MNEVGFALRTVNRERDEGRFYNSFFEEMNFC